MEVIGSHSHLPINNMEGMGNVLPPLSQSLHQNGIGKPFGSKRIIGSKTVAWMWALISAVRTLYHAATANASFSWKWGQSQQKDENRVLYLHLDKKQMKQKLK